MGMNGQIPKRKSNHQLSKMEIGRYFFPRPISTGFIITTTTGALLVLLSLLLMLLFGSNSLDFILLLLGLLLCLLGIWLMYVVIKANPSDQDYDDWLAYRASLVIPRAYQALNLQENQLTHRILCIHSILLPGSSLADNYRDEIFLKQGKDGKWRSSVNLYTYFFPAKSFIAIYTRSIDALNFAMPYDDSSEEYFYQDIISASFKNFRDTLVFDDEEYWYRVQQMSFVLSNGYDIRLGAYLKAIPIDRKQGIPTIILPSQQVLIELRELLRLKRQRSDR
jgi:hypothetical protein